MSSSPEVIRTLAAILMADVANYGRLMGDDEPRTVRTLQAYRKIFIRQIESRRGRVLDAKGDAIMAAFNSTVEAVAAAVAIQQEIFGQNEALPESRRMRFRIGINLGDVVEEDASLYGDGVNIAGRLESMAEPGRVCISRGVHDQIVGKLPLEFEYLGEHRVKTQTVRAYKVVVPEGVEMPPGSAPLRVRPVTSPTRKARLIYALIGFSVAALLAGGTVAYWDKLEKFGDSALTSEGPALPDKPSIAVLPFVNMSGDPEQGYFSDGITETLITDLSRLSNLFVIARTSTFTYKGRKVDVRRVGEELGVRYVLEGSVQRSGGRVRINVQLIDASTGEHLWAERYDRPFDDLFSLQDEITKKIITELDVKLVEGEQARMWRGLAGVMGYEIVMKGVEAFRKGTPEANDEAKQIFQNAIAADPDSAAAAAGLGWAYANEFRYGWSSDPGKSMARATELANRALAMDDTEAVAHSLLGFLRLFQGRHDSSLASLRKAISLQPNSSLFAAIHANSLIFAGKPKEALAAIEKAMRLSPFFPAWYLSVMSIAYHDAGRFEESIVAGEKYLARKQKGLRYLAYLIRTLAHSGMGQKREAWESAQQVLRDKPDFSLKTLPRLFPYRDPATIERMTRQLRAAGLT